MSQQAEITKHRDEKGCYAVTEKPNELGIVHQDGQRFIYDHADRVWRWMMKSHPEFNPFDQPNYIGVPPIKEVEYKSSSGKITYRFQDSNGVIVRSPKNPTINKRFYQPVTVFSYVQRNMWNVRPRGSTSKAVKTYKYLMQAVKDTIPTDQLNTYFDEMGQPKTEVATQILYIIVSIIKTQPEYVSAFAKQAWLDAMRDPIGWLERMKRLTGDTVNLDVNFTNLPNIVIQGLESLDDEDREIIKQIPNVVIPFDENNNTNA